MLALFIMIFKMQGLGEKGKVYDDTERKIKVKFENNYKKLEDKTGGMLLVSAIAFVWGVICLSGESVFVYFNF